MKLLAKVVFGWLAYNYVKHDLRAGDVTHVVVEQIWKCTEYRITEVYRQPLNNMV